MHTIIKAFGAAVRQVRCQQGLSQEELGYRTVGTDYQRPARVGGAARAARHAPERRLHPTPAGKRRYGEKILQEYEGLTPEDIQACLLFAAETRE